MFLTLRAIHTEPPAIHPLKFRFFYPGMCASPLSCIQLFLTPWTVGFSVHGISAGKNTRVDCHFLPQGIFLTQGLNPCLLWLLYWQVDSLPLTYLGAPSTLALILKAVSHKPRFLVFVCLSNLRDSSFPCALPSLIDLRRVVDFSVFSSVLIVMVEWQRPSALMWK